MRQDGRLHVVTCISNPVRFQSRYRLYREFAKRVADAGGLLTTVEVAFGDRPFAITERDNPQHVQLRTFEELWHKENMLNIGIQHISQIHPDWEYVAWVDADVQFARPDWVSETIHQLQHHHVVQMFDRAHDLGPNHGIINSHTGFVYAYLEGMKSGDPADYCARMHPGFAWAARREALDYLGGLVDFAILGAADKHMAMALIGEVGPSLSALKQRWKTGELSPGYLRNLLDWEKRAEKYIRRDIGYVSGSLIHYWHGKKANRKYVERWKILMDNNYDPDVDLKRDTQGLWQLVDDGTLRYINLRDQIRAYFRARNEDSIDL